MDKVGTKYCILENDGVSLCVCKHRPCEQLQRAKAKINELIDQNFKIAQKYTKLEQENEELKNDILTGVMCITCPDKNENCNLQVENERLKARLRPLEDSYFNGLSSIQITELAKKSIRITAENRKLEYALQEIRELIKKLDLSLGCAYGDYDCDNCSDINEETVCKIKLQNIIIDKINEVVGAE